MASPLVKRYLLALGRYKWAGLAGMTVILGASGLVATLQSPPPPSYRAEGVLKQSAPVLSLTTTGTEIQERGRGILSKEFLLDPWVLQQVAQQLATENVALEPDTIRRKTIIEFEEDDSGAPEIIVQFYGDDPNVTQRTSDLLFKSMVDWSQFSNKAGLRAIIDALNDRLVSVEAELRQAEQALEAYDRIEGPAIQASLDGSLLNAISGSQQQWRDNQLMLASIEAQMRSLQARLGMTPSQAYASSALSADPIIANLRAQIYETESQILLLSKDLRPAHPTIVQLQADRQAYEQLLRERAAEVVGGGGPLAPLPSGQEVRQDSSLDPARANLANQLVALETQRETLLQQQVTLLQAERELRAQYARLPNKQLERDRLAQQVALKRALYDQIQTRRIDAEAAEAEIIGSLRIDTPPTTELAPQEQTNPLQVLLVGGLIGLVAGGAIVFLLDTLDGRVHTFEDLQDILRDQDVPALGLIPQMPPPFLGAAPLLLQADSPYTDAYERLRSNLRLTGLGQTHTPTMILITSTREEEGKSTTATNLAIACARAGRRTLLVEADLRMPSQTMNLSIAPDPQASIEPLRYYGGQLGDCVRMVPQITNLYVTPSPGPQRQAPAILESSEMRRFLEDARGRFDMVILDAPALSRNNDAMLLEARTDGMVLVTRPGYTERAVLTAATEQLEESDDVRLLGVVINGADIPVDMTVKGLGEEVPLSPQMNTAAQPKVAMRPVDF